MTSVNPTASPATQLETRYSQYRSASDLRQFGINPLTGESCAYSMRTLCDVNAEGEALLSDFFGMPEITLAAPWNSQVEGEPSVGSVMLMSRSLKDIAQFAFFKKSALAVIESGHTLNPVFDQERLTKYEELLAEDRKEGNSLAQDHSILYNWPMRSSAPATGSRVTHAMSGRTV